MQPIEKLPQEFLHNPHKECLLLQPFIMLQCYDHLIIIILLAIIAIIIIIILEKFTV